MQGATRRWGRVHKNVDRRDTGGVVLVECVNLYSPALVPNFHFPQKPDPQNFANTFVKTRDCLLLNTFVVLSWFLQYNMALNYPCRHDCINR